MVNNLFMRRRKKNIAGYLFILPWLIGFCLFTAGPILFSIFLSFHEWHIFDKMKWIGIENYKKLFADPLFYHSLKVTFYYAAISVPVGLVVGLFLAVLLYQKVKGTSVFRTIFYIPSIVPVVATATLWIWIYNPEYGILNFLLAKIGVRGPDWLYSTKWVVPAIAFMNAWTAGPNMIIYLASLEDIPKVYWDAAKVDGANSWQRFWHITIPFLSPTTFFLLITNVMGALQTFAQAYIMGGGGRGFGAPANASLFYCLYLYEQGWSWFNMGYASSLSWVLTLIIFTLTLIIFKTSNKWVYYERS
ncbi:MULTISPECIES: carbohydrate ABC transporter permease [Pseudothermotoga]|jgi:multiple sugar transport system permease protein|uniref:carbohydrate ABC transporter permease n=2 Tax=Thermotogaceae TaxID=188709 RepID=UPI000405E6AA|nr:MULTISPECIES: sugar ABC transporter permease [Pseudothermotoga]MDK2884322.1 multiple sugar transport system permease protein [Pseudothermotoga sp.]